MSYPIFKQNCEDTVTVFRQGLTETQNNYVLERYREYVQAALGRPADYNGTLFSNILGRLRALDEDTHVYSQTCTNMCDGDCSDIEQSYSDSLMNAFGTSGYPFTMRKQESAHGNSFSNPVRLAWIFAALGVQVDSDLLHELENVIWDRDGKGFSNMGCGICRRLSLPAPYKLSDIFESLGLRVAYPFGRDSYKSVGSKPDGLIDPRRFTFLLAAVILGHWQAGTIEQAPVPGSAMWRQLALTTYRLTVEYRDQLAFFEEVFGIREDDTASLKFAVGDIHSNTGSGDGSVRGHIGNTVSNLLENPMLWIILGSCVVYSLGCLVAHALAQHHSAG